MSEEDILRSKWLDRLAKMESKKYQSESKVKLLLVRASTTTIKKFRQIFYELKGKGIINVQEDLIKALIKLYETRKSTLIKVLQREFH